MGGAFAESEAKSERLWGYIDKSGKMIISPQFMWSGAFSDGLAPVAVAPSGN